MTFLERRITVISLIVHNAEEFQAALPRTGLFEMFDCAIEINAPQNYPVHEVEQMVKILQYSINVTDVKVLITPEDGDDVHVVITDTPYNPTKRRTPARPKP
jgi:hypothetical protein